MSVWFMENWVCVDCLLFMANGDIPEDETEWTPDSVEDWENWVAGEIGEDESGYEEFSFQACDCCGSRLAGGRYLAHYNMGERE